MTSKADKNYRSAKLKDDVYSIFVEDSEGSYEVYTNNYNFVKYTKGGNYSSWNVIEKVPKSTLRDFDASTDVKDSDGTNCPSGHDGPEGSTSDGVENVDKGEKYRLLIRDRKTGETIWVDVYDVLEAFKITCSAMAHAIKKFLVAGKRGVKGYDKDCNEGINSVEQSKILEKYRN